MRVTSLAPEAEAEISSPQAHDEADTARTLPPRTLPPRVAGVGPSLALIVAPTAAIAFDPRAKERRALALYSIGIAGLASIGLFAAALPAVSIAILAMVAISGFVLASTAKARGGPEPYAIEPESIESHELRATYRTVLYAHAELDRAIAEAPRLRASVAPALERCREAVTTCGRMAQLANPLHRYLEDHEPAHLRSELERLRARADRVRDQAAIAALTRAAAARSRQLATYDQIVGQRDRIHARLELVRAALESFTATIVTLHGADEEQLVLAGESLTEHLDEIGDDLDMLASALDTDLAA